MPTKFQEPRTPWHRVASTPQINQLRIAFPSLTSTKMDLEDVDDDKISFYVLPVCLQIFLFVNWLLASVSCGRLPSSQLSTQNLEYSLKFKLGIRIELDNQPLSENRNLDCLKKFMKMQSLVVF